VIQVWLQTGVVQVWLRTGVVEDKNCMKYITANC
jgi:hypothetical protein